MPLSGPPLFRAETPLKSTFSPSVFNHTLQPENAIATHVDADDKTTTLIQRTGSNYKSQAVIINEGGLNALILSSKLPQAKKLALG